MEEMNFMGYEDAPEIPVYFINGFLESGKTEFINFTIEEDYFKIKELTLIIACEAGEKEYEPEALKNGHAVLEYLEQESDFNLKTLSALAEKYNPERIIIEFNGMWDPKNILLPIGWRIEEKITLVDATTFAMYYANMRSRIADLLRDVDVVVFNRCDNIAIEELQRFRRSVRAINSFGDIVFENAYGEMDLGEEELPFDIDGPVISLTGDHYAMWYLDAMERTELYIGKTIEFLAMAMRPEGFPEGWFIPGRIAMVCCEDDIAFLGYPCKWDGCEQLQEQQWVKVRARLEIAEWFEYEGDGPVFYAETVELAEAPEKVVIDIR